jgi:hypothetical protein
LPELATGAGSTKNKKIKLNRLVWQRKIKVLMVGAWLLAPSGSAGQTFIPLSSVFLLIKRRNQSEVETILSINLSSMPEPKRDSSKEDEKTPTVSDKSPESPKPAANPPTANEPILENLRRNLESGFQSALESIEKGLEDARRNLTEGYYSARKDIDSGIEDTRRNIGEGVESARTNLVSGLETARVGINSGLISAQENLAGTSSASAAGTTPITRPAEYTDEKAHSEAPPQYDNPGETADWRRGAEGQESGVVPGSEK